MKTAQGAFPAHFSAASLDALKWLAVLLMVIDHINKFVLVDAVPIMFALGRVAMPLFAFVLGYRLAQSESLQNGVYQRVFVRLIAFGVLAIGLTLFVRAWRGDPEFNADGAAFAACILAAGVAVPFLLGFIGVLLAAVLVPASTGMFARHWVQATQRSTAAAAWFCGLTVTPLASWFGGRADERPLEGFIAGLLLVAVVGALLSIRRFERSADRSSTGLDGG